MNQQQTQDILQTLGHNALETIKKSSPQVVDCGLFKLVNFWVSGQECEYFFDTEPPLLRQVETDKEFANFNQLIQELSYELA
jgi:hypothetical protein